jgi:peptidoglycan LD-endopeptidase LytH
MRGLRRQGRSWPIALAIGFCLGMLVHWSLTTYGPPRPTGSLPDGGAIVWARPEAHSPPSTPDAAAVSAAADPRRNTTGSGPAPPGSVGRAVATSGESADRGATRPSVAREPLQVPINGVSIESFKGGFAERRGNHEHEAVDIPAPRNTPVHAVEDGTIAKLFVSRDGGNTIYQLGPDGRLCYYYAHLQRYASELREGDRVMRGQVIGYVGTSGNAPPDAPHLHFAVFELPSPHEWWKGRALDPYQVFASRMSQ